MSDLTHLANHLDELVAADATLAAYLGTDWLAFGVPHQFPCVTIDGLVCLDDKLNTYTLNLNLYAQPTNAAAGKLEYLAMVERFKLRLASSGAIVGGRWFSRPEPDNGIERALFPSTVYLTKLPFS